MGRAMAAALAPADLAGRRLIPESLISLMMLSDVPLRFLVGSHVAASGRDATTQH